MDRRIPTATLLALTPALSVAAPIAAASSHVYKGSSVSMRYGPVRVSIRVSGRRIVSVSATYPTDRRRSQQINSRAIPLLKSEVLSAQSAKIHTVSGATLTSNAYDRSLQSALRAAHL